MIVFFSKKTMFRGFSTFFFKNFHFTKHPPKSITLFLFILYSFTLLQENFDIENWFFSIDPCFFYMDNSFALTHSFNHSYVDKEKDWPSEKKERKKHLKEWMVKKKSLNPFIYLIYCRFHTKILMAFNWKKNFLEFLILWLFFTRVFVRFKFIIIIIVIVIFIHRSIMFRHDDNDDGDDDDGQWEKKWGEMKIK